MRQRLTIIITVVVIIGLLVILNSIARLKQEIDGDDFTDVFAAGSELSNRQAVALVRGDGARGAAAAEAETS